MSVGFAHPAHGDVILNETFDGPLPAIIIGWAGAITDPLWSVVPGAGVNGTAAMQGSGTWQNFGGYLGVQYQNAGITGSAGATRDNTLLSFDLKVNVPDIYGCEVEVQSWKGGWEGVATASKLDLRTLPDPSPPAGPPWPDYDLPQEFQTFTFSLADPRWVEDTYQPYFEGLFDPSGDVYQVFFQLFAFYSLPLYFDVTRWEAVTVDNIRIWTVPHIENLQATPAVLWPPNHKMVNVVVDYTVTDPLAEVSSTLTVTSSEPVNGLGDGDTSPDWQIVDAHNVKLRAERSGVGNGRIYTITVTSVDALGNSASKAVTVAVPKAAAP